MESSPGRSNSEAGSNVDAADSLEISERADSAASSDEQQSVQNHETAAQSSEDNDRYRECPRIILFTVPGLDDEDSIVVKDVVDDHEFEDFDYDSSDIVGENAASDGITKVAESFLETVLSTIEKEGSYSADSQVSVGIFASDIGGTILKQALVLASKQPKYLPVLQSTGLVIFFGVAHRASQTCPWDYTLSRMVSQLSLCLYGPSMPDVIRKLSKAHAAVAVEFSSVRRDFQVINYYQRPSELQCHKPIIEVFATTTDNDEDIQVGVDRHQQWLASCRTPREQDFLMSKIKDARVRKWTKYQNFVPILSNQNFPIPDSGPKRLIYKNLCNWILSFDQLDQWIGESTREIHALVIGESYDLPELTISLVRSIRRERSDPEDVFIRLSDRSPQSRPMTLVELIASLCFQLITFRPRLFLEIANLSEELRSAMEGANTFWKQRVLWRCLRALILSHTADKLFLLINQKDQSADSPCSQLISYLANLMESTEILTRILIIRTGEEFVPSSMVEHKVRINDRECRACIRKDIHALIQDLLGNRPDLMVHEHEILDALCEELADLRSPEYFLKYLRRLPFLIRGSSTSIKELWRGFLDEGTIPPIFRLVPEHHRSWVKAALLSISSAVQEITCMGLETALNVADEPLAPPEAAKTLESLLCGIVEVQGRFVYITNTRILDILGQRGSNWWNWNSPEPPPLERFVQKCWKYVGEHISSIPNVEKLGTEQKERLNQDSGDISALAFAVRNCIAHTHLGNGPLRVNTTSLLSIVDDKHHLEVFLWVWRSYRVPFNSNLHRLPSTQLLALRERLGMDIVRATQLTLHAICLSTFREETEWSKLVVAAAQCLEPSTIREIVLQDMANDDATLHQAFRTGSDASLCMLAALKSDFVHIKDNRIAILHHAVRLGNVNLVQNLLPTPNTPLDSSSVPISALHAVVEWDCATSSKHIPKVFEHLISLHSDNCSNQKLLQMAAEAGHTKLASMLIPAQKDIDCRDNMHRTPLIAASQNGHFEIVNQLLRARADVNTFDCNGQSALHVASSRGFQKVCMALIKSNVQIDAKDSYGQTPLHLALHNDRTTVACVILEQYELRSKPPQLSTSNPAENPDISLAAMDIDAKDSTGLTPLAGAARRDNPAIVKRLLDCGADPNIVTEAYSTALILAILAESWNVFCILMHHDANVNICTQSDNNGPLKVAASVGNLPMVKWLLEKGAEPHSLKQNNPLTMASTIGQPEVVRNLLPLYPKQDWDIGYIAAASTGRVDTVEVLLDAGASKDAQDESGKTALHYAAYYSWPRLAHLLLVRRIHLDLQDNTGRTALSVAARMNSLEVMKLLIAAGAVLDTEDEDGYTPLYLAARRAYYRAVELLLIAGSSLKIPQSLFSHRYRRFLDFALEKFDLAMIEVILCHSAEKVEESVSISAIQRLVDSDNVEKLHLLLNHGLDANKKRQDNGALLHMAAIAGSHEVVKFLLKPGSQRANPHVIAGHYGTALQAAAYQAHVSTSDIVELLLSCSPEQKELSGLYGTALEAAARMSDRSSIGRESIYIETAKKLLNATPDVVNVKGGKFGTALQAAAFGGTLDMVKLLLQNKADPLILAGSYGTILHASAAASTGRLVEYILRETDLTLDTRDVQGRLPLHLAARSDRVDFFKFLTSAEITVESRDKQGRNALHFAAAGGALDAAKAILDDNPALVNVPDKDGWTPLHWACRSSSKNMITYLLENEGNTQVKTKDGRTPWHVAVYHDADEDLIRLLEVSSGGMCENDALDSNSYDILPGKAGLSCDAICDGCRCDIYGPRFHCKDCIDFDHCFKCHWHIEEAHYSGHTFEKTYTSGVILKEDSPL